VDILFLFLTYYWTYNKFIFQTENNRLDFIYTMFFQVYTGGRSIKFIYKLKNTTSQNPFSKKEKISKFEQFQLFIYFY